MNKERLATANEYFLKALIKGAIKPIVETAHDLFDAPIYVVDYAGRCICQVPNKYIGEASWDAYVDNKSPSLTDHLQAQKYYKENKETDKNIVYINNEKLVGSPYLMGQFYDNGVIAGHFGIFIWDRSPEEADYEIAELLSKILSSFYSNQLNHNNKYLLHYEYILHLLGGKSPQEAFISSNWEMSTILKPEYVVLVSPINEIYTNISFSHCVCDYISNNFKGTFPVVYDNNIVILSCGLLNNSKDYYQNIIKAITDCLASYNYITGISCKFDDIKDLRAYFMQALVTVNTGTKIDPGQGTYFYEDYAPLQIFLPVSEFPSPEVWLHPMVIEIKNHDEKYNTEYSKTLKKYILSSKDKKLSAKKLNIHINTLNYRLDRMFDLFKITEMSDQDFLHITCSYLLLNVLEP